MTRRRRGYDRAGPGRGGAATGTRRPTRLVVGAALVAVLGIAALVAAYVVGRPGASAAAPWARLGTQDVHSLAFLGDSPDRLLFGHHGGIMSSTNGGRSWQPLGTSSDAMSLGAATSGSIITAGHDVFAESRDGGRTWVDIPAALPSRDIHGFARDPVDPSRMWAYLATGGLWESTDGGLAWERVQEQNILFPVATRSPAGARLFGVSAEGLGSSADGGRTWRRVATPELYPIASLSATADGSVLVAGGPGGLARSDDGGASWSMLPFEGQALAIAVAAGGRTIGVVTRSTDFFRSDDGGRTWPGP